MALITRTGKGSKLTIAEMDGNLTYLDTAITTNAIQKLATTTAMSAYTGSANTIIVTDANQGGTFISSTATITNDGGRVFPKSGGGHWVRQTENFNVVNVKWYGAKGDGTTDDLAAFNAAVNNDWYYGKTLFIPAGNYILSNTWAIVGQVSIQGDGTALSHSTEITPSASFPAGNDLITITGGYSSIKDIRSDMNLKGGNWLTFIGEGGHSYVERCVILRVNTGYWGIELRDPTGTNGIAGMNINENHFTDFLGGAIWANGGGDSNNIMRNFFQLYRSTSHILKWDGVSGAAALNFSENNGGSAEKFIELNYTVEPKIMKNQLEALIPLTNSSGAMITINGNCIGATISDNNLNCHSGKAQTAIYLNDVQNCYITNNTITGATNAVKTTSLTSKITFLKGWTEGIVNDTTNAVSTIDGSGTSIYQGLLNSNNLTVKNDTIGGKLTIGSATNYNSTLSFSNFAGTLGADFWQIISNSSTNDYKFQVKGVNGTFLSVNYQDGKIGLNTTSPFCQLEVKKDTTNGTSVASSGTTDPTTISRIKYAGLVMDSGILDNGVGYFQSRSVTNFATTYPISLNPVGGNVGIGTDSPFAQLEIKKTSTSGASVATTGTTDPTTISRINYSGSVLDSGLLNSGTAYLQARSASNFATANSIALNPVSGNVGVGTDTPSYKFHVSGTAGIIGGTLNVLNETSGGKINVGSLANQPATLSFSPYSSAVGSDFWTLIANGSANAYNFWASSVNGTFLSIDYTNGKTGINTTSPFAQLEVKKTSANGTSVATTGTTDPTTISRIRYSTLVMDSGLLDNGVGYFQNRLVSNFATTYPISLNPAGGEILIGQSSSNTGDKVQVNGNVVSTQYKLSALNTAPSSSTATGTLGEIRFTATYVYVCTAGNTWVRSALATW